MTYKHTDGKYAIHDMLNKRWNESSMSFTKCDKMTLSQPYCKIMSMCT